jgi:hypothetical protein
LSHNSNNHREVKLVQFETEYPCLTLAVTVSWRGALRQFENKLFGKIDMKGGDEVVTPAKGKGYTVTLAFISSKDRFLAAVTIL